VSATWRKFPSNKHRRRSAATHTHTPAGRSTTETHEYVADVCVKLFHFPPLPHHTQYGFDFRRSSYYSSPFGAHFVSATQTRVHGRATRSWNIKFSFFYTARVRAHTHTHTPTPRFYRARLEVCKQLFPLLSVYLPTELNDRNKRSVYSFLFLFNRQTVLGQLKTGNTRSKPLNNTYARIKHGKI